MTRKRLLRSVRKWSFIDFSARSFDFGEYASAQDKG
jgi:hypothetical protein